MSNMSPYSTTALQGKDSGVGRSDFTRKDKIYALVIQPLFFVPLTASLCDL